MNLNELMVSIDLDDLHEFEYFEQFALLVEHTSELEYEVFAEVFQQTNPETLATLTDNYFTDIMTGVPDDSTELYSLMSELRTMFKFLAKKSDISRAKAFYIEELFHFRNWYMFEGIAYCAKDTDNEFFKTNVYDAMTLFRMEKINNETYEYDFSSCVDYQIEDYEDYFDDAELEESELEELDETQIFMGVDQRPEGDFDEDETEEDDYGLHPTNPVIEYDPDEDKYD